MKTFKEHISESSLGKKRTTRTFTAGVNTGNKESEAFHMFHDIMGSSDDERLISAARSHGNPPKKKSKTSTEIFNRGDAGVRRAMIRASNNPGKINLHARNIISMQYGSDKVPNYAKKLNLVKRAIEKIKPGDRSFDLPMI